MRRAALVAALLLATPALASAKGPEKARICGTSGCAVVEGVEQLAPLTLVGAPFELRSAPPPAPFFTVVLTSSRDDDAGGTYLYAPSASSLRVDGDYVVGAPRVWTRDQLPRAYWIGVPRTTRAALDRATAELEPFPAAADWKPASSSAAAGRSVLPAAVVAALLLAALAVVVARRGARRPSPFARASRPRV